MGVYCRTYHTLLTSQTRIPNQLSVFFSLSLSPVIMQRSTTVLLSISLATGVLAVALARAAASETTMTMCTDTCASNRSAQVLRSENVWNVTYFSNGVCDDKEVGGPCLPGTDCSDCGPREVPVRIYVSSSLSPPGGELVTLCEDDCFAYNFQGYNYTDDGFCFDASQGRFTQCPIGTDWYDCCYNTSRENPLE